MKKNKTLRRAAVLMVAVLMSTCAIGGTFAKYTTASSGQDTARVAKWGVELQVVGNLYGDSYVDSIVKDNNTTLAVQSVNYSSNTDDVVAPGTKNEEGFTFSLKGTPEVSGEITSTMKIQEIFLAAGSYGVMIPVDNGVVTEANFDEFTTPLYMDYGYSTAMVDKFNKETQYYTYKSGKYVAVENPVESKDDLDPEKNGGIQYYERVTGGYYKAVEFSSDAKYYTLEDFVSISNTYYPVIYKLTGGTNYSKGTIKDASLTEIAKLIAAQLGLDVKSTDSNKVTTYTGSATKKFKVNEDLAANTSINLDDEVLTWEWKFSQGKNGADTILGMLRNTSEGTVVKDVSGTDYAYYTLTEYTDYCLNTQFSIEITVSQTDQGETSGTW